MTYKLSEKDKEQMVTLRKEGWSFRRIAEYFGVRHYTVQYTVKVRTKGT